MSNYLIYLKVPPYLAQYYIHKRGGGTPVRLQRGTPEADVIEYALRPWPRDLNPVPPADANLVIDLPFFKRKDPRTYNYLPPAAEKMLRARLRLLFRIDLWNAMTALHPQPMEYTSAIYTFMEQHGIEDTETNYLAVQKIYQRLRQSYREKNIAQNATTSNEFCPKP